MSETSGLPAPVRVTLIGAFEPFTRAGEVYELRAETVRGLLRALDERHPGLAAMLEDDSAVAIDGVIHEIVYTHKLAPGCEVYFIPKLESG